MNDDEQFVTGPQLAHRLGLKAQTIRSWRHSGTGPKYFRLGDSTHGRVLYRITDVEQWLAAKVVDSTSAERVKAAARDDTVET